VVSPVCVCLYTYPLLVDQLTDFQATQLLSHATKLYPIFVLLNYQHGGHANFLRWACHYLHLIQSLEMLCDNAVSENI